MSRPESLLRHDEAEILHRAGRLLGSTLEPEKVYDTMRELVADMMDCQGLVVSTFNPEDQMIRCAYAWIEGQKVNPADLPPIPLAPAGHGMQSTVIRSGEPLRVDDVVERMKTMQTVYHVDADGSVHDRPTGEPQTRSILMVPIRIEEQVVGIVQLMSHRKAAYTDQHLRLLEALTLQMAAAGRNAWLYRKVEESEERFRQLAENIGAVFFMTENPAGTVFGRVIYVSPAYEKVWGRSCRSAIEEPAAWFDAVHPEDRAQVEASLSGLSEQPFEQEFRIRRPDGEVRWIHDRVFPVRNAGGRVYRWAGIAEDVTERKRLEQALHERMDALAEADRRKDQFLAMLSHELRNPLAPIRNAVAILRMKPEEVRGAPPHPGPLLDIIERQVSHLTRMLEDLIDMSAVSRRRFLLDTERLDVVLLVRVAVEDFRSVLEARGLDLVLTLPDRPIWVNGDATRLAQIVGNMLHNSAKFTDRGGRVHVGVMQNGADDGVEIVVEDSGIGIETPLLERIFEAFTQADTTLSRSRGGLGLGLALVKGFTELHGGRVEASSAGPGRGSRFTVHLPVEKEPAEPAGAAVDDRPTGPGRRILLIEDNEDSALSLRTLLELAGHAVETAETGEEGLNHARNSRPDLILCDLGLPGGMDGYDVAEALRGDPDLGRVELIALTGYGGQDDQKRVREAGFDRHLVKPVDPGLLLQTVARPISR